MILKICNLIYFLLEAINNIRYKKAKAHGKRLAQKVISKNLSAQSYLVFKKRDNEDIKDFAFIMTNKGMDEAAKLGKEELEKQ